VRVGRFALRRRSKVDDMPRPLRVQFAGAVYHVMNRGVRGAPLYTDAAERRRFLDLLAEACGRYEWQTLGYCLMGNHYHLVVRTLLPTLSSGMQWLNGCYARWFSERHAYEGHVLFRRFHSVLVESDTQLVDTIRYVLRNPVEAFLCTRPGDWQWSSYGATVGREPAPPFLSTDWLCDQFGTDMAHARANFAAFMQSAD
jgi:REP-associated tyrosine transposase